MSNEFHIKFDGVEGESTHKDHKGEIDVLSWSWGLSAKEPSGKGSGAKKGKVQVYEFTFTHLYDKASPALLRIAAAGRHIKQAVLTSRKAGEAQKDFLKITMKEVFITSVEQMADEADGITEAIALTSSDIAFEYRPASAKGALGPPVTVEWDVASGKVV